MPEKHKQNFLAAPPPSWKEDKGALIEAISAPPKTAYDKKDNKFLNHKRGCWDDSNNLQMIALTLLTPSGGEQQPWKDPDQTAKYFLR
jgi:hypothetical protein